MTLEDELRNQKLVLAALAIEGGLGAAAILAGWLLGMNPLNLVVWDWRALAWGSLAALPVLGGLLLAERLPFWPFGDVAEVVDQLLRPLFEKSTLLEMAVISISAGIGEELFFRGLLQEGLARWIGGPLGVCLALVVASLLFGLLHAINSAYVVLASVMGFVLGGLWLVSGNLLVPIAMHAVYDFLGWFGSSRWKGHARGSRKAQADRHPTRGLATRAAVRNRTYVAFHVVGSAPTITGYCS